MLSILEAVWQGRTIDLPPDKEYALVQLAHEIAAAALDDPEEISRAVLARERGHNCSIGQGVATPHVGVPGAGELVCAVGWSAEGLDYGACNGRPVHLVVMYRIPESKRTEYLNEMAAIAKALKEMGEHPVATAKDRTRLIDLLIEQTQTVPPATKVEELFKPRPGIPVKKK